ncbi:Er membrane protein dp1/yop1, partial [Globisporangium splendens]
MDKLMEYKDSISKRLERYDKIVELEKQTGVDKFYIFCAGAVLSGILLFVVGGASLVVNLVGFLYPAYQSFKAISTPNTDDDTQWLTYWVVYAFFNITESITDLLLSWIPFYFFIKVAFLVWCYHPSTVGSNVIYNAAIKPYFAPHVNTLDAAMKSAADAAKAATSKAL